MKLKIFYLFIAASLVSCSSSSKLIDKGYSKLRNGNEGKAEKKFNKAISNASSKDRYIIHSAYHGLSLVERKRGNYSRAEEFEYSAYQKDNSNPEYAYSLARYKAIKGDAKSTYNWLYSIGDCEAHGRGQVSTLAKMASTEPDFRSLLGDIKFQRFCAGYRRVKLSIDNGYSSESDKWTENDQFATVSAVLPNGERKIVLCTNTREDDNSASWYNQYVVFDYKLGSTVTIAQLDEDFTSHDLLSKYTGPIPWDLGLKEIKGTQSRLELSVSDTEQSPYTSGTSIPSTISPELIGIAIGGAIVYGAGELLYSGLKNSMASGSGYSSGATGGTSSSSSTSTSKKPCNIGEPKATGGEKIACDSRFKIYKVDCGNGGGFEYYYLANDVTCGILGINETRKGYHHYNSWGILGGDMGTYTHQDYTVFAKKLCGCEK